MGEKLRKTKKIRKAIKKFDTLHTRRAKDQLRKYPYPKCKRWRQIEKVGGMINWETGELEKSYQF